MGAQQQRTFIKLILSLCKVPLAPFYPLCMNTWILTRAHQSSGPHSSAPIEKSHNPAHLEASITRTVHLPGPLTEFSSHILIYFIASLPYIKLSFILHKLTCIYWNLTRSISLLWSPTKMQGGLHNLAFFYKGKWETEIMNFISINYVLFYVKTF